jgi:hypothetical protein
MKKCLQTPRLMYFRLNSTSTFKSDSRSATTYVIFAALTNHYVKCNVYVKTEKFQAYVFEKAVTFAFKSVPVILSPSLRSYSSWSGARKTHKDTNHGTG